MNKVQKIITGEISQNCYIIYKENHQALIVDPGAEPSKIKDTVERLDLNPIAILLTHTHFDHIGALEAIRTSYEIPVYVHPLEQEWLGDPKLNFSAYLPHPIVCQPAENDLNPIEDLTIGDFNFKVLPTPGHSPGSVSFLFEEGEFVLSGDSLFSGSIGRTDIPFSDHEDIIKGIQEHLLSLPSHYKVYSGHGMSTTIKREKETNPFFNR